MNPQCIFYTFFKLTFSVEKTQVLVGREEDLEEGRDTAAVTAVAMAVLMAKRLKR